MHGKTLVIYGDENGFRTFLVDNEELSDYPLDEMHQKDANSFGLSDHARDSICKLSERLSDKEFGDLSHTAIDPNTSFSADRVLVCMWMP